MSYSKITIKELETKFHLDIQRTYGLFDDRPSHPISELFRQTLEEQLTLALAVSTEKIRAELIVAPMLIELRRQLNKSISLFSGVEFEVVPEDGLTGVCDFLISRSSQQLFIQTPVIALVEAKKDDIKLGIPQCIAEMLAAQIYNAREGQGTPAVFGAVTTGNRWVFMQIAGESVQVDLQEYHIEKPEKILGILMSMIGEDPKAE